MRPAPSDTSANTPDRQHRRGQAAITLSLLFLAGVVNVFDRASLSVANTSVRTELHLNATQIGWLLSAFSLAYGFAQLPLVGLLDRFSTRSMLGVGLSVWSVAQVLTGFVGSLNSFALCRGLLGIGEAPFFPTGIRTLRDWFSTAARGRATALMNASQALGLAIAPPLLTALLVRSGWRRMFIVLGGAGLLVALAWLLFQRDRPHSKPSPQPTPGIAGVGTLRSLLAHRTVWGAMLGWGGVNYTVWLYIAWLPGYLEGQQHLSLTTSGWLASIPFLFGAAGMFASGLVADALGARGLPLPQLHRRHLITGMVFSAISTFLVAHAHSATHAVAGISLALFFIHFAGTSGWGYVQAVAPAHQVASLGALQNFASFVIASAAPVLTGWLVDKTHSFSLALAVSAAVTLLGALSYAVLAGTEPLLFASPAPLQSTET